MRSAGALALLLLVACGDQATGPAPVACSEGVCISDPNIHCVRIDDCETDDDCPSGLRCLLGRWSPACGEGEDRAACRPRRLPALNDRTLIAGFEVPEMTIAVDEPGHVVTWSAPPGTAIVACALFNCPPEVPVGGDRRHAITNMDRCAYLFDEMPAERGRFPLELDYGPRSFQYDCADPVHYQQAIDDLLVGCWAYDTTQLVYASRLIRISPAAVDSYLIPHEVSCPSDPSIVGPECYDPDSQTFGWCADGACRPRCLRPSDCYPPALGQGSSCDWTCEPITGSFLGVCRPG